jgi:hypothetical protein
VKDDPILHHVRRGWFKDVCSRYFIARGIIEEDQGAYLIYYNGFLRWPTSICPYASVDNYTIEEYFLTNLEIIQKDVECTFGILKKLWKVLKNGLKNRDITV